jgi:tripartite ATP-independent transporter DctP family solute receptor
MLSTGKSNIITGLLLCIFIVSSGFALFYRATDANSGVLLLAHGLAETHPVHKAMLHMQERLYEISGGAMQLKIYPSATLGTEPECLKLVQTGHLDMAKSSISPMESFWSELQVFTLPYIFRDDEHVWKVLDGEIGKEFLEMDKTLYGVCYYDAGARSFYSVKQPILSLDDLKGMKIRVQQSKTAMDMITCMGAAPTPIAFGEVYTALSQGTIDGAENNLPSFTSQRHSDVCKHFVFNEHAFVPDMLLINRDRWEKLTPLQKQWLQQAATESSEHQRKLWKEEEQRCRKAAEEQKVQFHTVNKAPFVEITKPMRENIADPKIREFIRRIEEIR